MCILLEEKKKNFKSNMGKISGNKLLANLPQPKPAGHTIRIQR